MKHRVEQFELVWKDAPFFRKKQFLEALFSETFLDFQSVSVFPKEKRESLAENIPWMMWKKKYIFSAKAKDTYKALLVSPDDGVSIETVLMKNARGHWTVCVSSQVGCAMKCSFCATGTMGFSRNLSCDEIIDQYRFWKLFLRENTIEGEITNIVYMGMGEPLANYEEVRSSLQIFLEYAEIGLTRITVSTVGMLPALNRLLEDPLWPSVRLAVSLHSADEKTRKNLMPTSYDGFLEDLFLWAKKYFLLYPERRRHLTFEYVILGGVNDTKEHAEKLALFAQRLGKVRINLIPWNATGGHFHSSVNVEAFQLYIKKQGVVVTIRRAMGADISGACGQLVVEKKS
jgi:23S rRNA (adenine2503-C2)-methyltransferase